jgi:hypothetical protein
VVCGSATATNVLPATVADALLAETDVVSTIAA